MAVAAPWLVRSMPGQENVDEGMGGGRGHKPLKLVRLFLLVGHVLDFVGCKT